MQIFETIQTVTDGKLVIEVPQNFEGKELKITVSENKIVNDPNNWASLPAAERVKILQQFAGSAKYPDTPIDKYEVYEQ